MGGSLTYRRDQDETVFRLELPLADVPFTESPIGDGGQSAGNKRAMAH
jgi:hypothetical protein